MTLRLYPRSLAGQLSALLIAAVLLAQVVTFAFFAESRRSAIDAAAREQVLGRIATLANLIEETPEAQRDRILAALSSNRLTFSVTATPLVERSSARWPDAETRDKLDDIFGPGRDIRAAVADNDYGDGDPRVLSRGNGRPAGLVRPRPGRFPPTLTLSVRLADGR